MTAADAVVYDIEIQLGHVHTELYTSPFNPASGLATAPTMDNGTNASTTSAVTSLAYHIPMWLLVISGILGNVLVVVWRCYRKESRLNLLSVLIVSLAIADLCFCSHYLLQEIILAPFVFGQKARNKPVRFTSTDKRLCSSMTFLTLGPMNAIMLTAVAIALYSLLSLRPRRYGNRLVIGFVSISWMACLVLGALAAWESRQYYPASEAFISLETFYHLVIFRCLQSGAHSVQWSRFAYVYPVIATVINGLSSLLLIAIYISLCCKIRKNIFNSGHCQRQEIDRFRARMTAISILNLVCWWPICVIYFVFWSQHGLKRHGVDPPFIYPYFLFLAAVSAANPIIYTIASKRFFSAARYACRNSFFCRRCYGEEKHILLLPGEVNNIHRAKCCGFLPCPKKAYAEFRYSLTSGDTGETSLFTDDV